MSSTEEPSPRLRREPPRFRRVQVAGSESLTPYLRRVTLTGVELAGLSVDQPAASVRLLVPDPGAVELTVPNWTGNEFLYQDGRRPTIRTFTPRRLDQQDLELDLDVVLHEGGAVSEWVQEARPGDPAAVSGPGRGYALDDRVHSYLLAGDETALPAICQLIEEIPGRASVAVIEEIRHEQARLELPDHPRLSQTWVIKPAGAPPGAALLAALRAAAVGADLEVWVAGEAAAMHQVRRHLFEERGLDRSRVTVRGYWKLR